MIPIITLFLVVTLSLIVTRIAAIILMFTGLSRDTARFQARSAFSGAGFTTAESEGVVNHPVRRRVIMLLMLLGNAGLVTIIASLMSSFVNIDRGAAPMARNEIPIRIVPAEGEPGGFSLQIGGAPEGVDDEEWQEIMLGQTQSRHNRTRFLALVLGVLLLWIVAASKWFDSLLYRFTTAAVKRWTSLEFHDFHGLLHLSEGYEISEFDVENKSWLEDKNLLGIRLGDEGVQILGIRRPDGSYIGAPVGSTYIRRGDTLIVHGMTKNLADLEERVAGPHGDAAHAARAAERTEIVERQRSRDSSFDE